MTVHKDSSQHQSSSCKAAPAGGRQHIYHSIICIGALIVHHNEHEHWDGAPGNKACA